jgi:hypothetical protein
VRVCHFRLPDGAPGPALRERIVWQRAELGYATSAEPGNPFGLSDGLSVITVKAAGASTLPSWEERYHNVDLKGARASYDDGLADIGARLVARFCGRVLERYIDGPR